MIKTLRIRKLRTKKPKLSPPIASIHDVFPRVKKFLLCIPLKWGCIIIGIICMVFCSYWHYDLLNNRKYHDNKYKNMIGSLWKNIVLASDVALAILSLLLIVAAIWKIRPLATLWIFGALQNAILTLVFEYFACPIHYQKTISEEAFKAWPHTFYYCTVPFIELYFIYVVNSFYIETPPKPKSPPPCAIAMTDFK